MIENIIHYGFGKDYLKNWGIKEALREIYQNFIDYGNYEEEFFMEHIGFFSEDLKVTEEEKEKNFKGLSFISLVNDWVPSNLEFLRIGRSEKHNTNAIGKHGEGVKMAFLILKRMGFESKILTQKYLIYPSFYNDPEIGECFSFIYKEHNLTNQKFTVEFSCLEKDYFEFKNNVITSEDVIYSDNYYGEIVNKPAGNIYSGGLFVFHADNIKRSYNIQPSRLPLDRDRCIPRGLDVNWATSKIQSSYGKWEAKDITYSDTLYVDEIPDEIKEEFEPKIVGNSIQFVTRNEKNEDVVVGNSTVAELLKSDEFFSSTIMKLKKLSTDQKGIYDMLVDFKNKYIRDKEALIDFEIILEKIETEIGK